MQTPLEEMCRLRKENFNSAVRVNPLLLQDLTSSLYYLLQVCKLNEMLKETMTYMERVERKIEGVRGERQKVSRHSCTPIAHCDWLSFRLRVTLTQW